jgi:hypothetical protein
MDPGEISGGLSAGHLSACCHQSWQCKDRGPSLDGQPLDAGPAGGVS